jgi:hypothetical protein
MSDKIERCAALQVSGSETLKAKCRSEPNYELKELIHNGAATVPKPWEIAVVQNEANI